ncbi:MAG TPA: hypothetical protein VMQ67_13430, partial [Candidatus Saccharimonadales bacterium]|nr:hypothetical protein [Candidatus Saccharimonadales bacterium]
QQHRQWRQRKGRLGQMVQLDGSHHDWFEGRRAKAVLMVMVDDATNQTGARFFEEETTRASFETFDGWVEEHGFPAASMWIGTASTGVSVCPRSLKRWLARSRKRSLAGP